MEFRFEAEEWRDLTAEQKARRCRFMAREAHALANGAPPDQAIAYKNLASEWLTLADEIERNASAHDELRNRLLR